LDSEEDDEAVLKRKRKQVNRFAYESDDDINYVQKQNISKRSNKNPIISAYPSLDSFDISTTPPSSTLNINQISSANSSFPISSANQSNLTSTIFQSTSCNIPSTLTVLSPTTMVSESSALHPHSSASYPVFSPTPIISESSSAFRLHSSAFHPVSSASVHPVSSQPILSLTSEMGKLVNLWNFSLL
jgi:hypothetical protein